MRYLLVIFLVVACFESLQELEPGTIQSVVADVYSDEIEEITLECASWLETTVVLYERPEKCFQAGCHYVNGGKSYIWCKHSTYSVVEVNACYGHEYLHALQYCMTGIRDREHDVPGLWCKWGQICDNFLGADTDSVEFKVNEILLDMS